MKERLSRCYCCFEHACFGYQQTFLGVCAFASSILPSSSGEGPFVGSAMIENV